MPECRNPLQESLKAYLDGELKGREKQGLEAHLQTCPACQSELEGLRRLSQQLTQNLATTSAPLPDHLRARILATLPEPPAPRPQLLPFWRRPGPLAAFGGALAMGCAAFLWMRTSAPGGLTPRAATAPSPQWDSEKAVASAPVATEAESKRAEKLALPKPDERAKWEAMTNAPAVASPPAAPKSLAVTAIAKPRPSQVLPPEVLPPASAHAQEKPRRDDEKPQGMAEASGGVAQRFMSPSTPALDAPMASSSTTDKKSEPAKKKETSSGLAAPMAVRAAVVSPVPVLRYTLTVPKGKKAETEEAVRKLADELAVPLEAQESTVALQLGPESRESVLSRLKELGALIETPTKPLPLTDAVPRMRLQGAPVGAEAIKKDSASSLGSGGLGGGRGGAALKGPGGRPLVTLTLEIQEEKPNSEQAPPAKPKEQPSPEPEQS